MNGNGLGVSANRSLGSTIRRHNGLTDQSRDRRHIHDRRWTGLSHNRNAVLTAEEYAVHTDGHNALIIFSVCRLGVAWCHDPSVIDQYVQLTEALCGFIEHSRP